MVNAASDATALSTLPHSSRVDARPAIEVRSNASTGRNDRPVKDVVITVHPGTGHAFMGPHNALGTHNAELAAKIWPQAVSFLHQNLDLRESLSS